MQFVSFALWCMLCQADHLFIFQSLNVNHLAQDYATKVVWLLVFWTCILASQIGKAGQPLVCFCFMVLLFNSCSPCTSVERSLASSRDWHCHRWSCSLHSTCANDAIDAMVASRHVLAIVAMDDSITNGVGSCWAHQQLAIGVEAWDVEVTRGGWGHGERD